MRLIFKIRFIGTTLSGKLPVERADPRLWYRAMKSDWDIQNASKCIKKDEKYTFNSLISLVVLGFWHDALVWHSRGQEFNSLQLHHVGN